MEWITNRLRAFQVLIAAFFAEEDGSAVVEGLLVLCVLIALAVSFRTQLIAMVQQIFRGIQNQTGVFY